MFDKPENLENSTFLLGFFSFLFLILPGIALLFVLERDLFLSLDWIKLILLACAISVPVAFCNIILSVSLTGTSRKEDFMHFSLGIIMGGLSLYIALAISYFKQMSIPSVIMLSLVANILFWISIWRRIKKNKT